MKDKHFRLILKDEGYDIYRPRDCQSWGYRYGPSIMVHDGICEAWFASPGDGYEADWFTYRRSEDGGKTWTDEKVVMAPTPDSMDWFSVCDPGVFKYGDYYYIGYTSTIFSYAGGVCNNGFVARSKSPTGPFFKWTGEGWGETRKDCHWAGKPAPIIYYDECWRDWGAGELSFVVKDKTLYMYYTWTSKRTDGSLNHSTRVATADITREDWPLTIKDRGIATRRENGSNDSYDVVYCEDLDKFISLSTDKRFTEDSILAVHESDDGITFRRVNEIKVNTAFMCHNCGISGDCLHHIKSGDLMLLGYAYGNRWGNWGARLHRYDFAAMDEDFYSEADKENMKIDTTPWKTEETPAKTYISPGHPHYLNLHVGESRAIDMYMFDVLYRTEKIEGEVQFSNYDRKIIELDGKTVKGVSEGYTYIDADYEGLHCQFLIYVRAKDFVFDDKNKKVVSFTPVQEIYRPTLSGRERKQIRGMATYSDGSFFEICEPEQGVVFKNLNPEIMKVAADGCVYPDSIGTGEVEVRCGELGFKVKIEINE